MAFIKEIQTPDNIKHKIKNTIIPVIGTQTASTGSWTGDIDLPELYDGLTIAYFLPYAPSGNATLNLTLNDGVTTTGAINCYYNTGRLTTHFGKGSNIIMTYWSAGSIKVDGTATTDNRWIVNANYADGNDTFTVRHYYLHFTAGTNGIKQYSLIFQIADGRYSSLTTTHGTGTSKAKNTPSYYIDKMYYYGGGGNIAEDARTGDNTVSESINLVDLRYSLNITTSGLTGNKPLYIVFNREDAGGGTHTLADSWWSQTLPTEDDNKIYVYMGTTYDGYRADLNIYHYAITYVAGIGLVHYNDEYINSEHIIGTVPMNNLPVETTLTNTNDKISTSKAVKDFVEGKGYTTNTGTVTSVGLQNDTNGGLTITNSPITTSGTIKIKHTNQVTAGTASGSSTKTLTFGDTFDIPTVTYDVNGHITGKGTTTMTMPSGGILSSGLEIRGHIAGDSSSTGHGLYGGGGYHNAYNNILLHGDNSTGSSGIAFVSDKVNSSTGVITNVNQPSDRAFIQYHACGVTTATAEGTNPTLATSGEAGRLVIGIGNDSGDKIWFQAPGQTDLIHQRGATSAVIPDTGNTTGTVGSSTRPVYVNGGVLTQGDYTLAAACAKGVVTSIDTSANLPTSNAVKTYVDSLVANATHFKGGFDASSTDGTIDNGSTTLKSVAEVVGDLYTCTTAGTIYGITFEVGDSIIFKNAVAAGTAPIINDFISVEGETSVSVVDNNPTLSWSTKSKVATIEGTEINVTMPSNPNTDTKVNVTLATTTKAYLLGTSTTPTSTAQGVTSLADTGVYLTTTAGQLAATTFSASGGVYVNTANSGSAGGLALYATSPTDYGIAMRGTGAATGNLGKHGFVQGDWAGYFNFTGVVKRGWIFRHAGTNIGSINGEGKMVLNGSLTIGGNQTNTSGCRMEYNTTTQSLDFIFN